MYVTNAGAVRRGMAIAKYMQRFAEHVLPSKRSIMMSRETTQATDCLAVHPCESQQKTRLVKTVVKV